MARRRGPRAGRPPHAAQRRIRTSYAAGAGARAAGVVALAAALLAACTTAAPPQPPALAMPAAYPGAIAAESPALAALWWKSFGDPVLDALVEQALAANLDLALAAARVDEAAVAVSLARAAQWPQVDAAATVTRSRTSPFAAQPRNNAPLESTLHRAALTTTFEIDLWGRLRHADAAARAQLLAARHGADTVRVTLVGTLAQTYFGLRAIDAQLRVLDAQLDERGRALRIVERRVEGGLASALEAAQARTALAAAAAQRPELLRQRSLLTNQLGVLTGQPGLTLAPADAALPQPDLPPPGLPSQLLERRPDVQQAMAAMRASFEQFEVVHRGTWPTLSLTGTFGAQSADLADLLKFGARFWTIGPSLLATVFDAGRNRARTDEARARAEQAAINYRKVAQTAFREVADALAGARQYTAQEVEVERQRAAAAEALRLAGRRYEAGYTGQLELLDAQRSLHDAELAALRARQARIDATLALIKALGGGWNEGQRTAAR